MLARLILRATVAALLSGPLRPWVAPERVDACADTIALVVMSRGGSPVDALIVGEWAGRESGCDPDATSKDGNDHGIMQQRGPAMHGHTAAELRDDPELAIGLWIDDLNRFREKYGTARALSILSIGGNGIPVAPIVRRRCTQAGLGVDCSGT